jgi:hypothetical protein
MDNSHFKEIKVMKKTNVITPMWHNCQSILKSGDLELADNKLMEFVWKLADYTMEGFKDADVIEGVKLETWKERVWFAIENAGLLPELND